MAIVTIVVILGSMMYLIEGAEHGFTSIPVSIYWAIVTLTTVGYGDLSPKTPLGQALSVVVMILGYSIIAVPTGIFSVELTKAYKWRFTMISCPECGSPGHDQDAKHCKYCGEKL
jgi:voltage-gated potassium channel